MQSETVRLNIEYDIGIAPQLGLAKFCSAKEDPKLTLEHAPFKNLVYIVVAPAACLGILM